MILVPLQISHQVVVCIYMISIFVLVVVVVVSHMSSLLNGRIGRFVWILAMRIAHETLAAAAVSFSLFLLCILVILVFRTSMIEISFVTHGCFRGSVGGHRFVLPALGRPPLLRICSDYSHGNFIALLTRTTLLHIFIRILCPHPSCNLTNISNFGSIFGIGGDHGAGQRAEVLRVALRQRRVLTLGDLLEQRVQVESF